MSLYQYLIHGYPVIGHYDLPPRGEGYRPGRIIIVDKGEQKYPDSPRYVTGLQCREGEVWDDEWNWGHYFVKLDDARIDFADRCERGY